MATTTLEENGSGESSGVVGGLTFALARMIPDFLGYKTERDLLRCGYYHPQAYDNYLAIRNLLFMGTLLTTMGWAIALADQPQFSFWVWAIGLIGALMAFAIPRVYLTLAGDSRVAQIIHGLPDAIDILVMGLSGGLTLQRSLEHTSEELEAIHPSLAQEFRIISRQTSAASLEFAVQRFSQRVDEEELTSMTDVVRIASSMGTALSEVLRQHADSLRQSRLQNALRRGNLVGLKMLFPTIFCLAPAAFILILMPPLLELRNFQDREGKGKGALNQKQINRGKLQPRR